MSNDIYKILENFDNAASETIAEDWGSSDWYGPLRSMDEYIDQNGLNPETVTQAARNEADFYYDEMGYDTPQDAVPSIIDAWKRMSERGQALVKMFAPVGTYDEMDESNTQVQKMGNKIQVTQDGDTTEYDEESWDAMNDGMNEAADRDEDGNCTACKGWGETGDDNESHEECSSCKGDGWKPARKGTTAKGKAMKGKRVNEQFGLYDDYEDQLVDDLDMELNALGEGPGDGLGGPASGGMPFDDPDDSMPSLPSPDDGYDDGFPDDGINTSDEEAWGDEPDGIEPEVLLEPEDEFDAHYGMDPTLADAPYADEVEPEYMPFNAEAAASRLRAGTPVVFDDSIGGGTGTFISKSMSGFFGTAERNGKSISIHLSDIVAADLTNENIYEEYETMFNAKLNEDITITQTANAENPDNDTITITGTGEHVDVLANMMAMAGLTNAGQVEGHSEPQANGQYSPTPPSTMPMSDNRVYESVEAMTNLKAKMTEYSEYSNEPGEVVADTETQLGMNGGLNKTKRMFRKEYPGDNPMAVEEGGMEDDGDWAHDVQKDKALDQRFDDEDDGYDEHGDPIPGGKAYEFGPDGYNSIGLDKYGNHIDDEDDERHESYNEAEEDGGMGYPDPLRPEAGPEDKFEISWKDNHLSYASTYEEAKEKAYDARMDYDITPQISVIPGTRMEESSPENNMPEAGPEDKFEVSWKDNHIGFASTYEEAKQLAYQARMDYDITPQINPVTGASMEESGPEEMVGEPDDDYDESAMLEGKKKKKKKQKDDEEADRDIFGLDDDDDDYNDTDVDDLEESLQNELRESGKPWEDQKDDDAEDEKLKSDEEKEADKKDKDAADALDEAELAKMKSNMGVVQEASSENVVFVDLYKKIALIK